jgi:hypothetical protein
MPCIIRIFLIRRVLNPDYEAVLSFFGTPTKLQVSKRQVSKRQFSKRLVSKRLKRQVYKTSGLQNARFT